MRTTKWSRYGPWLAAVGQTWESYAEAARNRFIRGGQERQLGLDYDRSGQTPDWVPLWLEQYPPGQHFLITPPRAHALVALYQSDAAASLAAWDHIVASAVATSPQLLALPQALANRVHTLGGPQVWAALQEAMHAELAVWLTQQAPYVVAAAKATGRFQAERIQAGATTSLAEWFRRQLNQPHNTDHLYTELRRLTPSTGDRRALSDADLAMICGLLDIDFTEAALPHTRLP